MQCVRAGRRAGIVHTSLTVAEKALRWKVPTTRRAANILIIIRCTERVGCVVRERESGIQGRMEYPDPSRFVVERAGHGRRRGRRQASGKHLSAVPPETGSPTHLRTSLFVRVLCVCNMERSRTSGCCGAVCHYSNLLRLA